MPLKISSVIPGSPAESLGLKPGDRLLSINGEQVRDTLDFHFCVADEDLEIEYLHETSRRSLSCYLPAGEDMGIEFEQEKIRTCGNDCLFCFVDQNPEGLRKTLYVKDEDYRLSFLHGNFITLTNLKDWEIERIIRQRLSPLYISVHSTDPDVRKRLLRPRQDRDILKLLGRLAEGNIRMHTQIVLCPGYNDGNDLLRTIDTLAEFYPAVESLAIVPLGMTDHREKTSSLDPVTPELAREIMMQARPTQRRFRRRNGITWLYLSDEFYRLVGRPVPPAVHYDDFPQLENGIGLTRNFFMQCDEAPDLFGRA
ncbi:MAG: DUF512 domain-containing protein, partial [Candidatus Eisenbacteria bacterium]|nr:DUF512 domain-containing protein [Candidatus Eisenbacteria bacterium]